METLASPAPLANALRDDGSLEPAEAFHFSDELALALFDHMVLLRLFQERVAALEVDRENPPRRRLLRTEAATLGAISSMHDDDWVFPGGHEFAAALWRGVSLVACAHDALGNTRGSGARGASGRLAATRTPSDPGPWKQARIVRASRIGASQVPHAVGVAWAARLRRCETAALVLFADGATGSADFHAGLNFAGVTRAPVIAVCCTQFDADGKVLPAAKAVAYGLTGVRVDGTDVVAVRNATREARVRAASGLGGTLIEARILPGEETDPLARLAQHLRARGAWADERQEALATEMGADVDRALADASAPDPSSLHALFEDVYAEPPWHLNEQRSENEPVTMRVCQ